MYKHSSLPGIGFGNWGELIWFHPAVAWPVIRQRGRTLFTRFTSQYHTIISRKILRKIFSIFCIIFRPNFCANSKLVASRIQTLLPNRARIETKFIAKLNNTRILTLSSSPPVRCFARCFFCRYFN